MKVVHNVLTSSPVKQVKAIPKRSNWAKKALYNSYKEVLKNRAADIEEIQQYFPGWLPSFEY